MRRLALLFTLVSTSMALAGCAPGERRPAAGPGVTETEIVLGSWGPLSGPAALWGAVLRGMDVYFDLVNEEGGIHGRQIRFVYRDDGYEPPRTVAAVRELVQREEVFAFVGGIGTAPGMAVRDFIGARGIPWVSPASGSSHWAYPPQRNLFSVFPLYVDEAAVIVEHAVEELGARRIGVLYQNDDYGKGGLVGAQMAAERLGAEIVAATPTEIMDTDLASHVLRLRQAGAEAVLLWVLPRQAAIALGTAANVGFRPHWLASITLSDAPMMHQITEGLWEGVVFAAIGDFLAADDPTVTRYREAFSTKYPDIRWGAFPAAGFVFAEPLVEGLRRAGPELTREALIEALEGLEGFQGTGPEITFGPDRRQGTRSVFLARCVSATEIERVTDWIDSQVDVEEAIRRMGG